MTQAVALIRQEIERLKSHVVGNTVEISGLERNIQRLQDLNEDINTQIVDLSRDYVAVGGTLADLTDQVQGSI